MYVRSTGALSKVIFVKEFVMVHVTCATKYQYKPFLGDTWDISPGSVSDVNPCPCHLSPCPCPCRSSPWQVLFLNLACNTHSIVLILIYLFSVMGFYCATQICIARTRATQRGWLGGWLAVRHSRYCIKTTKPILKLFDHLVAPS